MNQKDYMREYARRPYVRAQVTEYQKWYYKCTDVGKSANLLRSIKTQLKEAKNEETRFNLLIKLAFANISHKITLESCGGLRGRFKKESK